MANQAPIGVTFLPSDEPQANGPRRRSLESDLGEALRILGLGLSRVQGPRALAPAALLHSTGAAGLAGGFSPQAAIFTAMIHAMTGRGTGAQGVPFSTPVPRVVAG